MTFPTSNNSYKKLIYSIIDYVATVSPLEFEISSYVSNSISKNYFSKSKIATLLKRKSKFQTKNRLFLTISFDDTTYPISIEELSKKIIPIISKYSIISKQLNDMGADFEIEFFSKGYNDKIFDFFAFRIIINQNSSIECIFSLHSKTKKLIAMDEDNEIIEFHSPLNNNINTFKKDFN